MSTVPLAEIDIQPGHHKIVWKLGAITLHGDTIIATVIAGAIILALGFWMRRRLSVRQPGGVQLFFETVSKQVEDQVESSMGIRTAPWVVPLAMALFLFILFANWLSLIPTKEYIPPPASDPNTTYALAILVILTMHVMGVKKNGLKYYAHIFEKPRALIPLRIVEEIVKPVTLALRLFGNIFAGTIMIAIIVALPTTVLWIPEILWKLFDAFIGLIQAFIFALLTVLYLSSLNPHASHPEEQPGTPGDAESRVSTTKEAAH
ncbi:ATP synthase F0 subcomplex A subunit [Jatrophihabitans endophyticus]|uniref:ATP synthase subunit a n=1 Tax=Jatrophihabitans endophyticus TaxID=1206085 RepID=A0A1M5DK20_9ACTN|nr:F0F1 ATP synthase subunit A [Jatrophihabitans endophyticus]SHF67256.1 ATP synthase F0 subcomplex A subunit [Jatrophihabitans endophyticus]